jgi:hypothetical protein
VSLYTSSLLGARTAGRAELAGKLESAAAGMPVTGVGPAPAPVQLPQYFSANACTSSTLTSPTTAITREEGP